ncbi:hypothetical protein SPBR_02858 [Sporothrix brasiliensis 5110]|uniref:Uncharacterized protein n=1 Tax=Sporothrix brasiliensis 5110 TaxID=1398154 RepID=A0A0C2J269_9PEZI|nr:uncharacterized protein SPBR_02858 [Sporothrix brasiliensis 5110]KIH93120.1 hypothetical protein SPBR_02858 [Sporothrix brasiliensis 5110]
MSSDSAMRQWTLVLVLTALFLSLVVVGQIVARYGAAYRAAPREIAALLDSADSSLHENESYDRDVAKVSRRDDKIRLGRLLGEIQRAGDDLREDLNNVLVLRRELDSGLDYPEKDLDVHLNPSLPRGSERRRTTASTDSRRPPIDPIQSCPSPRLRTSARVLWASKRTHLEERLRRLDLLRMRFLVVYMSIVAATATAAAERVEKSAEKSAEIATTNAANAATATTARSTLARTTRNISNGSRTTSSHSPSGSGSGSGSDDSSCSSSSSSAANSPLISATPSMPSSPSAPTKTAASIVAASIAAAAAAAVAAGDTDDVYYPLSPASMPGSPGSPGFGHPHPFLRSIQQQSESPLQEPSPPATPNANASADAEFDSPRRKPPSRRVTTLGIRPPDATPEHNHRAGWIGVVQELQRSPLLHKRHTSIEMSMARR